MHFLKKLLQTALYIILIYNFSFASSYKLVDKEIKKENKQKKYSISVKYPQMEKYSDKSIQEDFNKYVLNIVNEQVDGFKKDMNDWQPMQDMESEFEIGDTIFIQNENLISIRLDGYQFFSGSAHPSTFFISMNYDLKKNEPIKFPDLFTGDYLKTISDLCIKDLIRQKNEYTDNPDVSWIQEGAGPKDDNYKVFNILENFLLITFPAYQVASYAEGPRDVSIVFSSILKIINKNGPLGYLIR